MASIFPPAREAELVTFTQNFASKIATGFATYSLTTAQATAYGTLSAFYFNSRKQSGPAATPISANLPGGGVSMSMTSADEPEVRKAA